MHIRICLSLILVLFSLIQGLTQVEVEGKSSQAVVIETDDGSEVYGFIIERTNDYVIVESASLGSVNIPMTAVTKIRYFDDVTNIIFDNNGNPVDFHNSTHYFLFPSGYSLKKGQSYYENIWIFANSYSYGITDNITLSVGAELASLLFFGQAPVMYLSPKFSVPFGNQKGALGINATVIALPGSGNPGFGFLSASATFGSRNNNVTIGAGGGFSFEFGITDEVIPLTLSFMKRLGKKVSIMSENWFIIQDDLTDADGYLSAGMRLHFKEVGNAINIGFFRPLIDSNVSFIAFPFVSATVAIGKK